MRARRRRPHPRHVTTAVPVDSASRHRLVDGSVLVHDRQDQLVMHALTLAAVSLEDDRHSAVVGGSDADRTLVAAVIGARRERDGWVVHRPGPANVHQVLLDLLVLMQQRYKQLTDDGADHAAIGAPVLLVIDPLEALLDEGHWSLGSEGEKDLEWLVTIAALGRTAKIHVLLTAEHPRRRARAGTLHDLFCNVPSQLWLDDGGAPIRILKDAYPC